MKIKVSEIAKIIQDRIENYHFPTQVVTGKVVSVSDGVVIVQGLDDVGYFETLVFANGSLGLAFSLEKNHIGVVVFNKWTEIKENDSVQKTDQILSIPVGNQFLGRVVDPLSVPIDGLGEIQSTEKAMVEKVAPGVIVRESVNQPLETGVLILDALLPIGKGQRELIVGDRQTGKTTLAVDTIINQVGKNVVCVYVAIAQKTSSVLKTINRLKANNALKNTVVVLSSASQSEAIHFLTPFSGMTHAEFFLKQGKDVLIVFDDLSKHAVAYRGLSLLLKQTSGRQAYPGDIFYLHSRLLERAVKLNPQNGGGSITALPIIETQMEDLTAYIPTNVISITDGQIFLLSKMFNLGFKPAVDLGLSVSRVGSSAQTPAIKKMVGNLKLDLASYHELKVFSQLGGSLDGKTQKTLEHGAKVMEILKQREGELIPQWIMCIILWIIKNNLLEKLKVYQVTDFKNDLIRHFLSLKKTVFFVQSFANAKEAMTVPTEKKIAAEVKKIMDKFVVLNQK